jgi:hypothetical protein
VFEDDGQSEGNARGPIGWKGSFYKEGYPAWNVVLKFSAKRKPLPESTGVCGLYQITGATGYVKDADSGDFIDVQNAQAFFLYYTCNGEFLFPKLGRPMRMETSGEYKFQDGSSSSLKGKVDFTLFNECQ